MEETYTLTKTQIEEAFKKYNAAYLANPESFSAITETSHFRQAELLIGFLESE
jgi:hypothetical protein